MVFPPTVKGPWSTTKTSCINTTTFFFNLKISPKDLTILNIFRSTKAMLIRLSMVLCWQDLIFLIEIQASFTSNTFKSSFRLKLVKKYAKSKQQLRLNLCYLKYNHFLQPGLYYIFSDNWGEKMTDHILKNLHKHKYFCFSEINWL